MFYPRGTATSKIPRLVYVPLALATICLMLTVESTTSPTGRVTRDFNYLFSGIQFLFNGRVLSVLWTINHWPALKKSQVATTTWVKAVGNHQNHFGSELTKESKPRIYITLTRVSSGIFLLQLLNLFHGMRPDKRFVGVSGWLLRSSFCWDWFLLFNYIWFGAGGNIGLIC
jgi:hypothetical protein